MPGISGDSAWNGFPDLSDDEESGGLERDSRPAKKKAKKSMTGLGDFMSKFGAGMTKTTSARQESAGSNDSTPRSGGSVDLFSGDLQYPGQGMGESESMDNIGEIGWCLFAEGFIS